MQVNNNFKLNRDFRGTTCILVCISKSTIASTGGFVMYVKTGLFSDSCNHSLNVPATSVMRQNTYNDFIF